MILQLGKKFIIPQWLAGIGVTLLMTHIGFIGGWASPTLARLANDPDSAVHLTPSQASWIASLVNVGRFLGSVLGALAISYLGSRRAVLATGVPLALGWLAVVAAADRPLWLYLSRLSSGLGLGMAFVTAPLYLGEVSMPEIRGALVSLAMLGAPFGQVVSSACGSYLGPSQAASLYLALALLLIAIFARLPESPYHLLRAGDRAAALASIHWYRAGRGVEAEVRAVEEFLKVDGGRTLGEKLREFGARPRVRGAMIRIAVLFTLAQWCGLNVAMNFMEDILRRGGFDLVSPSLVVIYANACSIASSIISIFLIDRCGRKFLLVLSSLGTTVALAGLAVHFALIEEGSSSSALAADVAIVTRWLPMTSMCLFMFAYFLGLLAVPSAILGELFPADVKCVAACLAILAGAVSAFASTKTYQPMVEAWGEVYVFTFYAALSAVTIPYAVFCVPETKGKTLQEIQIELAGK